MKETLRLALLFSGAALFIVACADQKGFEARKARPEDALIKEFRDLSQQEQKDVANWAKVKGNFQKALVQPATVPASSPQGGTDAGAYVDQMRQIQQRAAEAGATGVTGATGATGGASKPDAMGAEVRAGDKGNKAEQDQLDAALETQAGSAKIQVISEAAGAKAGETIKALELFVEEGTKKEGASSAEAAINLKAETYMTFDGKDYFVLGQGQLTLKDQYSAVKLVELKVKAKDQFHNEVELKGIEMYGSCLSADGKSCGQMVFLALVTAADGKKAGLISTWSVTGEKDGRLKLVTSSMGDKVRTVREAQELSAPPSDAKQAGAVAPTGATSGAAGGASQSRGLTAPTGVVAGSGTAKVQEVVVVGKAMTAEQKAAYDKAQANAHRDNDAGYSLLPKAGAEDDMTGLEASGSKGIQASGTNDNTASAGVQQIVITGKALTQAEKAAYDKAQADAHRDNDAGYSLLPKAGAEDDATGLKRSEPEVGKTYRDRWDVQVKAAREKAAQDKAAQEAQDKKK